jgi:hypothetical protein
MGTIFNRICKFEDGEERPVLASELVVLEVLRRSSRHPSNACAGWSKIRTHVTRSTFASVDLSTDSPGESVMCGAGDGLNVGG